MSEQEKQDKKPLTEYDQIKGRIRKARFHEIISKLTLMERAELSATLMPEVQMPGQISIRDVQKFCRLLQSNEIPFAEAKNDLRPPVKTVVEKPIAKVIEKPVQEKKYHVNAPMLAATKLKDLGKLPVIEPSDMKDYVVEPEEFDEVVMTEQAFRGYFNTLGDEFVQEHDLHVVGGKFKYLGTIDNGAGKFRMFKQVNKVLEEEKV